MVIDSFIKVSPAAACRQETIVFVIIHDSPNKIKKKHVLDPQAIANSTSP